MAPDDYHKFTIELKASGIHGGKIYLDDKPLRGVKSISIEADGQHATRISLEIIGSVAGQIEGRRRLDNDE